MHPTVVAALAAERHNQLLREAEHHRRIRLARAARPTRRVSLGESLRQGWQQLTALAPAQRTAEPCCA